MSVHILSPVWEHSKQEQGNLLVLLALADYADNSGRAYPSVHKLSKKARLSTRQVQRILKELEAGEEIRIEQNAGPNGVNVHVVGTVPAAAEAHANERDVTPDKMSG